MSGRALSNRFISEKFEYSLHSTDVVAIEEFISSYLVVLFSTGIKVIEEGANRDQVLSTLLDFTVQSVAKYSESELFIGGEADIVLLSSHYSVEKRFQGHTSKVIRIFFNSNNLYSASEDFTVRSWDIESMNSTILYTHDSPVKSVDLSPALGLICSTSSKGDLYLYSISQGRVINLIENIGAEATSLKLISSKSLIAIGTLDSKILLKLVPSLEDLQVLQGHSMKINHLDYYDDASLLVSASDDRKIGFWNLETFTSNLEETNHQDRIIQVLIGKNGKIFSVGEDAKCFQYKFLGSLGNPLENQISTQIMMIDDGKRDNSTLLKFELIVLAILLLYVIIEYLSGGGISDLFLDSNETN